VTWVQLRLGVLAVCAFVLGGAALCSSASAQDIRIALLSIGERTDDVNGMVAIGIEECLSDPELLFELNSVPQDATLDVYVGNNCQDTTRNDPESDCDLVHTKPIDAVDFELGISLSAITAALDLSCESGSVATPTLWFLAVSSSGGNEDVGTAYGKFPGDGSLPSAVTELRIDTDPPTAPTDVSGGSGERQIPVSWDSTNEDVDDFLIYLDSTASPDSDGNTGCSSDVLIEGADPSTLPGHTKRISAPTARSTDLSSSDIDGDLAAVGVVAVDEAGNRSPLSNVDCVAVVPTDGFWDLYRAQGGQATTGCALQPARTNGVGWMLPLAALLLLRLRRWRRR
jgi:hypothetical protein